MQISAASERRSCRAAEATAPLAAPRPGLAAHATPPRAKSHRAGAGRAAVASPLNPRRSPTCRSSSPPSPSAARRRRRHKIPSAAQGARRREVDGGGRSSFEGDRRDIRREELEAARDAAGHRPVRRPVPPPLEQGLAAGPQQGAVGGRVETNRRVSFANAVTETTARRRREAPGI